MVPAPYGYCFKLFNFFRSCKILFGLVKFMTAPDRMSGNVCEVFVNTVEGLKYWIWKLGIIYTVTSINNGPD